MNDGRRRRRWQQQTKLVRRHDTIRRLIFVSMKKKKKKKKRLQRGTAPANCAVSHLRRGSSSRVTRCLSSCSTSTTTTTSTAAGHQGHRRLFRLLGDAAAKQLHIWAKDAPVLCILYTSNITQRRQAPAELAAARKDPFPPFIFSSFFRRASIERSRWGKIFRSAESRSQRLPLINVTWKIALKIEWIKNNWKCRENGLGRLTATQNKNLYLKFRSSISVLVEL